MKCTYLTLFAAILFSACQDSSQIYAEAPLADMQVASMERMAVESVEADRPNGEVATAQSYLAYRYNYQFALPVSAVKSTADAHAQACLNAGPERCQILSRSTNEYDDDNVSASMSLRAEPGWLEGFSASMIESIDEAKGQVTGSNVYAEDLTRQILDVGARLNAQKTLRDRLSGLLETRDAELSDLLALERELARVQGEIESATSTLTALRQRVNMSVVDVNYQTKRSAVSSSALSPIGEALKDFVRTVSSGVAAVIYFVAMILPWILFVLIPLLLLWRWWRKRNPRKSKS